MPATRAGDLAAEAGMERDAFKVNVRKLKGMGLTESLGTGYRLSPLGEAVLEPLEGSSAMIREGSTQSRVDAR